MAAFPLAQSPATPSAALLATSEPEQQWLIVRGARQNNLKGIDVPFPIGAFTAVTGVSGSGKSSLVNDILWKSLAKTLHRAQTVSGAHDTIEGIEHLNKVIRVDQQPIGQTPTSNPATYTGAFELIRGLFAQLPDSKLRGYTARRFSFNVPGGRCEKCEGAGQLKIEMHFLPDVWIPCEACDGKRYDRQTLEVKFHGHSIADVLEMSCGDALRLFSNIPPIRRILRTLCDVGLDYLSLGQAAPTLSGGEAQRVKLATELARPDTGRTLYLLDEPTTGLHFDDLQKLLDVLHRLVDIGNTAIVIEHNLDVIKNADWIVDLGPEAGVDGGHLVFAGTPEELVNSGEWTVESGQWGGSASESSRKKTSKKQKHVIKKAAKKSKKVAPQSPHSPLSTVHSQLSSHTAAALLPVLEAGPHIQREIFNPHHANEAQQNDQAIHDIGAGAKMPWEINGPRWHTKDRVSRRGQPIRWDGRILSEVVAKIEKSGNFAPTDWNNRTIVEIRGEKKSLGWFFHAITAEEWLLKMKFRTARNTFRKEILVPKLDLKPLNDMETIPLYGTESRVRVQRATGPWQEIELRVHSFEEVNRPEFWQFLQLAMQEFAKFSKKSEQSPNDLMPWKILGEKWHFLPRGLVGGETLQWDYSLLHEIFGMLKEAMIQSSQSEGRVLWTNKILVPVYHPTERGKFPRHVFTEGGRKLPWTVVHTKRVDAVYVDFYVAKHAVPLGRVRTFGVDPFVNGENENYDIIQLKFTRKNQLKKPELSSFLEDTLKKRP